MLERIVALGVVGLLLWGVSALMSDEGPDEAAPKQPAPAGALPDSGETDEPEPAPERAANRAEDIVKALKEKRGKGRG